MKIGIYNINIGRFYILEDGTIYTNKEWQAISKDDRPEKYTVDYKIKDLVVPTPDFTQDQINGLVETGYARMLSVKAASLADSSHTDAAGAEKALLAYGAEGWLKTLAGERAKVAKDKIPQTPEEKAIREIAEDVFKQRSAISGKRAEFLAGIGLSEGIKTKKDAVLYTKEFHVKNGTGPWTNELKRQIELAAQAQERDL